MEFTSSATKTMTASSLRRWEIVFVCIGFAIGSAFLLKMCYLSLLCNTAFTFIFLLAFYFYLRVRLGAHVPPMLLVLVFAGLQVDAMGNYFHMYGSRFGPMQYDGFSHLTVQILVTPLIIWLLNEWLSSRRLNFPRIITYFFAAMTIFSLSAFYEIIELWDEVYFHGQRIWGKYDTATDLQWDLIGIIIGLVFSVFLLKQRTVTTNQPQAHPQLERA